MSQLPITSRVKRSPLLKGSPYKQTETPEANVVRQGEDETIEKDPTITEGTVIEAAPNRCGTQAEKDAGKVTQTCEESGFSSLSAEEVKKREIEAGYRTEDKKECDPGFTLVDGKCTKIEKGDDVIAPTYSKRTGDVGTNFDDRQLGRKTKFKNRLVRQSKLKLAKAEDKMANFKKKFSKAGVDEDGKPTTTFTAPKPGEKGYKQYMRLDSKISENTTELADFESASENQAEIMRSGKTIGKSYRRDEDRRDTAADQTKDERIAQVRAEQEAANDIVSGGQAVNAVEVNNTSTTTGQEDTTDNTQYGKYETKPSPAGMRSAFKMKAKSPAAKKLQGNQGRLPQHLQDAIKAAPKSPAKIDPMTIMMVANAVKSKSSNKMRSGFKMKGYGKK